MNLKPLHSNVIIKALKEDEASAAGIILPDTAEEDKPERGEVIAVGDGKILANGEKIPLNIKVGDKVVFKKYSPDEVKINNEEYLIISEDDILATIS